MSDDDSRATSDEYSDEDRELFRFLGKVLAKDSPDFVRPSNEDILCFVAGTANAEQKARVDRAMLDSRAFRAELVEWSKSYKAASTKKQDRESFSSRVIRRVTYVVAPVAAAASIALIALYNQSENEQRATIQSLKSEFAAREDSLFRMLATSGAQEPNYSEFEYRKKFGPVYLTYLGGEETEDSAEAKSSVEAAARQAIRKLYWTDPKLNGVYVPVFEHRESPHMLAGKAFTLVLDDVQSGFRIIGSGKVPELYSRDWDKRDLRFCIAALPMDSIFHVRVVSDTTFVRWPYGSHDFYVTLVFRGPDGFESTGGFRFGF